MVEINKLYSFEFVFGVIDIIKLKMVNKKCKS